MKLYPWWVIDRSLELYTSEISTRSRIIYWIIILSIGLLIIVLPSTYVDISVQARGIFQSAIEKQVISSPGSGRVLFSRIVNGTSVKSGDTLFVIDFESIKAGITSLREVIRNNESCIHDLEVLTNIQENRIKTYAGKLLTSRYRSEFASFNRRLELLNHKYERSRTDYLRSRLLFEQKVISLTDYHNSADNFNIQKKEMEQLIAHQRAIWGNDLANRIDDNKRLMAELESGIEEAKSRVITSPVDGKIIQSSDIQQGSFLIPGQMVAEISPDSEIVGVFFINPADIGFMRVGQKVRIQVDAYNYHQWGMLNGTIREISDDVIFDGTSAFFRVRFVPDQYSLSLNNGISSEVIKGMTFTARVILTRRSLFDLLFDKADKWLNPYQGKTEFADNAG